MNTVSKECALDITPLIFNNAEKARKHLESALWPDGPICPHCGNMERIYEIKSKGARPGLRMCSACRKQFTITVGTIFENSPISLNKWLMAWALFEQKTSILQISKTIKTTYKTARYMVLRIKHDEGLLRNGELFQYKVTMALYNLTAQGKIKRDGKLYSLIEN